MALPVVPATVKASLFYTMNGQPAMNRIHIGTAATLPSEAICAAFAADIADWWNNNCRALVPTTMELRQVQCQSIAETNGPQATFSSGLPLAGTLGQPSVPNNVSFCISLRSGLTGRSARGRWFWAGLTEGQLTGNNVDAGPAASIVAAIDALLNSIAALGGTPVIVSYNSGGGPRPGGPVKFVINDALAVDTIVDSQRGRLH